MMLKVAVILLTLFNCIAGEVNTANALLPLARTDVSLSLSNSSMLVERIIADPKLFVSQMASADPVVLRNVIGMLKLLNQTGTTRVTKFERDVTEAKADEDAKIKIHDDLSSLVDNLTKTEENLVAEKLIVTATIVTKTEEKRVAGLSKTAAVAHHTSMVAERDANVPDLTTDNAAISSVISILEGLLPAPTAAPTTAAPTTAAPTTAAPTTAAPTTAAPTTAAPTTVAPTTAAPTIGAEAQPALLGDRCGGFRESTCGGFYFAAMGTGTWDPNFNYRCPVGFRWISSVEYTALKNQSSTCNSNQYQYYSQCGWYQYRWDGGVERYYFRFSDSTTTSQHGYYLHVGNTDGHPLESSTTTGNFAGLVCSADDAN